MHDIDIEMLHEGACSMRNFLFPRLLTLRRHIVRYRRRIRKVLTDGYMWFQPKHLLHPRRRTAKKRRFEQSPPRNRSGEALDGNYHGKATQDPRVHARKRLRAVATEEPDEVSVPRTSYV